MVVLKLDFAMMEADHKKEKQMNIFRRIRSEPLYGIQLGMGKGGAQYHQDRLTY